MSNAAAAMALQSQRKKTNHILHFILTLLTGGLWIFIWILLGLRTRGHNKKIDDQIQMLMVSAIESRTSSSA